MKVTILIILLTATMGLTYAQGKLDRAKEDLSSSSSSSSSSTSYSSDNNPASESLGLLDGFVIQILYTLTYGALIGEIQPRTLQPFPYADEDDEHGEYNSIDTWKSSKRSQFTISNTVSIHPDIIGNDLKLSYRFIPVLGLDVNHLHFFQSIGESSNLGMTSFLLNFYRIRERNVTGYWGMGLTYVGNEVDVSGFAYNLGLDIYLGKPISLALYWKQSFINESSINEGRVLIRYHLQRFDIHGGFIYHQLGGERAPSSAIGVSYRL